MKITDAVDCEKYPYVMPFNQTIKTYLGPLYLVRGLLADGATGVLDLSKPAFFAHDLLYIRPIIEGRRIRKWQCDIIYGQILFRNWRLLSAIYRPIGLQIFGHGAWRKYRRQEKENPDFWQSHIVPKPQLWLFPGYKTEDAVWIGPKDMDPETLRQAA